MTATILIFSGPALSQSASAQPADEIKSEVKADPEVRSDPAVEPKLEEAGEAEASVEEKPEEKPEAEPAEATIKTQGPRVYDPYPPQPKPSWEPHVRKEDQSIQDYVNDLVKDVVEQNK